MKSVPSPPHGGRTPYGIWLRDLQAFQATRRNCRRRSSVDQGPPGGSAEIVSGRVEPAQG